MAGDPRILDNLPDDGRPWRLTYAGGIARAWARQTPMIRLHFAPYIGVTRTRSSLLSNRSYDWGTSRVIEASASDLAYFTIGSLWTAGTPEAYPAYEEITVDVNVVHDASAPGGCAVFRGDGIGPHGNRIIPPSYYTVPTEIAEGRVVVFPMRSPFRALIIPCSEIFRFYYYGVSGKLGRALLDGTYITHRGLIVSERDCVHPDPFGYAYVRLGKCIDDEDAYECARIQFSPEARYEALELMPRAIAGRCQ